MNPPLQPKTQSMHVPNPPLGGAPLNSKIVTKQNFEWRKVHKLVLTLIHEETQHQAPHTKDLEVFFADHLIGKHIQGLQNSTLICKFSNPDLIFDDITSWARHFWVGLREIFLMEQNSKFFISIFYSKEERDKVHREKGWFCQGSGLCTFNWYPNFKVDLAICQFFPIFIAFPSLPLE